MLFLHFLMTIGQLDMSVGEQLIVPCVVLSAQTQMHTSITNDSTQTHRPQSVAHHLACLTALRCLE